MDMIVGLILNNGMNQVLALSENGSVSTMVSPKLWYGKR